MKPTWQTADGRVQLYLGDCLEILPTLSGVDAVVTDPPYNVGKRFGDYEDDMPSEEYVSWCSEWFGMLGDVRPVVLTPGVLNLPQWSERKPSWVYCWTTASETPGGRAAMRMGWEPLVCFGFPIKPFATDVLNYAIAKQKDVGSHPCPKPAGLFSAVVQRWTKQGDTVLDPFMGSGTTGVACVRQLRKFIGIESHGDFFWEAVRRIEAELCRHPLLEPPPVIQRELIA